MTDEQLKARFDALDEKIGRLDQVLVQLVTTKLRDLKSAAESLSERVAKLETK